jgi:hypothetical protein
MIFWPRLCSDSSENRCGMWLQWHWRSCELRDIVAVRDMNEICHFFRYVGCRTYSTRAQNGKRWDFLGTRHSITAVPIYCVWPASLHCAEHLYIYTHIWVCRQYTRMNYRCYQTTPQWNIFTQIGAGRIVDWIFIVGTQVWWWLGEYMTLDRTFYSLLFQTGSSSSPFSSLSRSSKTPLLEI